MLHERSCGITASFAEHLKFQEKLTATHALWINGSKINLKTKNQDTIDFQITTYRVLHERSNKTEHLIFQEKMTFIHALWVNSGKSKHKN